MTKVSTMSGAVLLLLLETVIKSGRKSATKRASTIAPPKDLPRRKCRIEVAESDSYHPFEANLPTTPFFCSAKFCKAIAEALR